MSPQESIAHYKIVGKLGEGGMGEVYRALDTKLNREVAIKVLPESFARDPDRMARFAREAHVLASLNHPNIAAIHGVEDRAIVMELVEGATLAGPMPLEEALPIIQQLIDALEYAHEKGVVHRDLKPANVKVTPEGRVKVLDFGLAKAMSGEAAASDSANSPTLTMRATTAGVIMGTAAYMSPEQARGQKVDKRADIWAFGVVVYELVTGKALFEAPTVTDTLAAVLTREPSLDAVPPKLRRLVRVCLARDARQRMRDISGARLLLDEAPEAPVAAQPKARGLRWWNVATGLVALAGLAVAALHFAETPPEPAPMRFQIPAPEKTDFGNTSMALSPDGRRLAFIASGADGRTMLWVRPLDSLTAQSLAGTEGTAFLPFWSPDSRFIGFGVQGKLKKVEASGGPPQTLSEIPGVIVGGSWSRDGVIIFGTSIGGLFRVPQAGGTAIKLTTTNEAEGEIGHLRPWFLPDGRHFLYVTRARKTEDQAIYIATLDGPERKRLVATRLAGAYAPPTPTTKHGHLLFLRETTLMAQPMDPGSFELMGEPFPVAEQVGSTLAMGYFSVSANGLLAYRSGGDGAAGSLQLTWFDREGKALGTVGPGSAYIGNMALAPDGKRVAVDGVDAAGNRDVGVLDIARGVPTRFTFDAADDRDPVWSPDGSRLIFSRGATNAYDLYQKASSGAGNEELLLKSGVTTRATSWSPDGRHILFESGGQTTRFDIWVLPVAGASGDRKPISFVQTPFVEGQGQFSPDGRWIVYTSDESAAGQFQVYVQSFPAGAGKFQVSTGVGGSQPRWRRDGKEIFYLGSDLRLMAVDVKTAPTFEAGVPKALFLVRTLSGAVPSFRYDVSTDGARFLVNALATASENSPVEPITVVLNWQAGIKR